MIRWFLCNFIEVLVAPLVNITHIQKLLTYENFYKNISSGYNHLQALDATVVNTIYT